MYGNDMEKYNLGYKVCTAMIRCNDTVNLRYKVWTAMIWRNIILGITGKYNLRYKVCSMYKVCTAMIR